MNQTDEGGAPAAGPPRAASRTSQSRPQRLESWLASHRGLVLAVIVAVSLLLRVGLYVQLNDGPNVALQHGPNFDMDLFHQWAGQIAHGDILTDQDLHPLHTWHEDVARIYFEEFSGEPRSFQELPKEEQKQLARNLWTRWYGGRTFHQEPLYPYLLALTYTVFPRDYVSVLAWQAVIGIFTNVLIYLLARRYFGDLAGTLAGLLAVLCSPLMAYEFVLLRAALITFIGLLLVFLTELAVDRKSRRLAFAAGLALGLAVLLKTTFVLLGLGMLIRVAYRKCDRIPDLLAKARPLLAGALVGIAPGILRNVLVGVPLSGFSSVATVTFVSSNNVEYEPRSGFRPPRRQVARIMAESDGRALPAVIATLESHGGLGSYLRQLWGKFSALWHWLEIPNNVSFYYLRRLSSILCWLPVTFWLIAPLAIIGMLLAIPRGRSVALLYWLVASYALPMLLFYVLSRFRVPMMAALIPFAALTPVRLLQWYATGRRWKAVITLGGIVLVSLWTMRPLPSPLSPYRGFEFGMALDIYYQPMEEAARQDGDWERATQIMADMLRTEPGEVKKLDWKQLPQTHSEAQIALAFSRAHLRYAEDLEKIGEGKLAERHREDAQRLSGAVEVFRSIYREGR